MNRSKRPHQGANLRTKAAPCSLSPTKAQVYGSVTSQGRLPCLTSYLLSYFLPLLPHLSTSKWLVVTDGICAYV